MTYAYPHTPVFRLSTWRKEFSLFPFLDWIFMYKTEDLKIPFDQIHETTQATLRPYLGESVEQMKDVTEINIAGGVCTQ